jgi:hypothetical protein
MSTPKKERKSPATSEFQPAGPRTLADDIASIPPAGAPEAIRHEDRRKARERGVEDPSGQPIDPD